MRSKKNKFRLWVQIGFFIFVALVAFNHSFPEAAKALPFLSKASLHAICPFGGVVTIYQFVTEGTFTKKIHSSAFILMWIVFVLTVFLGPVFCGWVCPFGSFQEWLGKIGKKLFPKKHNRVVPEKTSRILKYLRYVVLGIVLYFTAVTGKIVFSDYDPYFALFNFLGSETAIASYVILALVVLLSFIIDRSFCKYACPYGAVLGIFNFFRVFKIRRTEETCTSCGACDRNCPMNINVSKVSSVLDHQCISCMECTSELYCPVDDTVALKFSGKGV